MAMCQQEDPVNTRPLLSLGALASALLASSCSGGTLGRVPEGAPEQRPVQVPEGLAAPGITTRASGAMSVAMPGAGAAGSGVVPEVVDPNPAVPESAGLTRTINLQGSPRYYRVSRLTNGQWTNSVQALLGLPSPPLLAESFQEAVSGTTDFTNNELVLDIDSRGWSDYQAAAETLASQVVGDPALLAKLYPGVDAAGFIASVGRRVYRRPLAPAEITGYRTLFEVGSAMSGNGSGFEKGASVVLEAMLQSPHFLYRTELGQAGAPLSGYEVATKLSFWLRNTTPDDALLDAAERGDLNTQEGIARMAARMLDEPAASEVMREFHGQLLHFDRFSNMSKVGVEGYDPNIHTELEDASYRFFDRIFSEGLGVEDIFLATTGFVGPYMAPYYGLEPSASEMGARELGEGRLGYFTQLPFLMLNAHNDDPDAIHRGVSISLDVLCAPLGPPAAVIPPLPTPRPGQTNRQRVDEHTSLCGGACHNDMINPLGFAFENFDGMGQYREQERNGDELLPIDSSGSFAFIDGRQSWDNAEALMRVLATDPQAHLCYAKKLASFGLQRDVVRDDLGLLEALSTVSRSTDGSLKEVMLTLVKHAAFRMRAGDLP